MLYEKKMLILSGDGKGVVLIEKSAHGVRFSLRTFDMPTCDELKAGIITRTAVFVRDLPSGDNPAAVFTVDAESIDELHFAVFDRHLRLYGTNGKRMWEANLMDLLNKNDRRAPVLAGTPTAALPPIAPRPQVLPMPDGTGIPQSRLAIYGDEAIAESDFYTPLDLQSRMPEVDSFLDSPRVLEGLAPRVVPPPNIPARELAHAETTAALDGAHRDEDGRRDETQSVEVERRSVEVDFAEHDGTAESQYVDTDADEKPVAAQSMSNGNDINAEVGDDGRADVDNAAKDARSAEVEEERSVHVAADSVSDGEAITEQVDKIDADVSAPDRTDGASTMLDGDARLAADVVPTARAEAAATVAAQATEFDGSDDMPWALTARWLKNRTKRMPLVRKDRVRKTPVNDNVRFLRKSDFFERTRADIDKLFANAEPDKELSGLLTDIDWVKVEFDGRKISVGRGGNAFLCYAVTGVYEKVSPLGDEAQWLPAKRETPTGEGYWLIFQNLANGRIIKN